MKIDILSNEERAASGFTHKVTLPYTDIKTQTSTTAFSILASLATAATGTNMPVRTTVLRCLAEVTTAFVFSPGTLVFTAGDGGDAARYIASVTLKTAARIDGVTAKMPHTYDAADTIDLVVTAGAGALTSITAGELVLYFQIGQVDKIA